MFRLTAGLLKGWIQGKYGSRRGLQESYKHRLLNELGRYRHYKEIDWDKVERLIFVCTGNICRSAYAESVARTLGLDSLSCGIHAINGARANDKAIIAAEKLGYDLTNHRTSPIMYHTIKSSDLFIAMEPWQAHVLSEHMPRMIQCTLLGLWSKPILPHIHDPYGLSEKYFETCFKYIKNSVYEIAERTKK